MRLVYFGTPETAVPPLLALQAAGHEIVLVVSGADKRRGRGRTTSPSPVKAAAVELGLPVTDEPDDVLGAGAELGVVVAFGRIIRPHLLAALPMVNLHFSLLPRWRGAAPVERAILAGDDRTGVCVMAVDEGLDTGEVFASLDVPIGVEETADELRGRLVNAGTGLLVDTISAGLGAGTPQSDDGVTYAHKITTEDLHLDWTRPAHEVLRTVRVGGAWTTWHGARFKVHGASVVDADGAPGVFVDPTTVACGERGLLLSVVQPEGKPRMDAADWSRGAHPTGEGLGG